MRLHVGCAMWSLKSWQGRFIPASGGDRLRSYAGWCNAVEGNTTFYATPTHATVSGWAEQAPADFRFVLKLPREITHGGGLGDVSALPEFLRVIEPLGDRVHALWIQLPGSFGPGDLPALSRLLGVLPDSFRYAVEVRDPAFFHEPRRLEDLLTGAGAEWVPFDTTEFFRTPPTSDAERDAWLKKPRMPSAAGARGCRSWPAGCARGGHRRSSCTPRTMPTPPNCAAASTTRCARWCRSSSRFRSRPSPRHRPR
jgi:uncharacterized protein YecE (DUF72 family)